ncbi:hypothetical protein I4U23_018732 [Adineta vaga]|nr:hypothetical protein I4U23_018732 [Adineta vaga]
MEFVVNERFARTLTWLSYQSKIKDKKDLVRHQLLDNIDISWYKTFQNEFSKEYFQKLTKFLADQQKKGVIIYPSLQEVFTFTRLCKLDEVKVVILGQDPYHSPNQAHGLSFSVRKNTPIPSSLRNIFKELQSDIPAVRIPKHGTLFGWASQGVLLLNICLTVENHRANSHKGKGWEIFTDTIIQYLNDHSSNIVFLLWGRDAQTKESLIDKVENE